MLQEATARDAQLARLRTQYGEHAVRRQLRALERHGAAVDDPDVWLRVALERRFKYTPIETVARCACGSSTSEHLCRFIYWNLLGLRQCRRCGLVFVSPRPTRRAIQRIFSRFYFRERDPEFWGHRRLPIFREVLEQLVRLGCNTVFDVGAAYGHLIEFLRRQGMQASGCDVSQSAVAWGRNHLGVELHPARIDELRCPPESVDAVTCLDTLYYTPDPAAELLAMWRLLRPGGYVILRLRNYRGIERRAKREGRKPVGRALLPAPHLWAFTPPTISRVLQSCGFTVVVCEPAAYSATRFGLPFAIVQRANRLVARAAPDAPILTRSFNVVARKRPCDGG